MNLLEIYKEKNKNPEWFLDHSSLAKNKSGRMFEYTSTNFRSQKTFTEDFVKFLEVENKPRNEWPKQKDHGQEIHKQYVTNMLQSKLFKKSENDIYSKTAKGILYNDFINLEKGAEEEWFINYIFLLNGYYLNRKNYIIYRVKNDLLGCLLSVDSITEESLAEDARKIIIADSFGEILRSNFFYIHSFYNDSDFLINYFRSSGEEKEELASYIEGNLGAGNFQCCISTKYQLGGNFNKNMLADETRVFLLTLLFIKSKKTNLDNIYNIFVNNFDQNIFNLNKEWVFNYLNSNKNIFDPIFEEIIESEDVDMGEMENVPIEIIQVSEADRPEDYIDETSEIGRQKIKAIYIIKKKQAKIQGGYKCALETINNCRPIYFTAKVNGKNYLELHHLVPREFRNDFSYSIDVLANYVTLCPRCHRQIHLAIDRERKHLVNALFEERKNRLKVVGLNLDLKDMYEYYKIEE